jgi:translocation protein SEC63
VIGERLVTPSSIVFFIVKLRLSPPRDRLTPETASSEDVEEMKRRIKLNEEKDAEFLTSRKDAEDVPESVTSGWAHAPYWPGVCMTEITITRMLIQTFRTASLRGG